MSLWQYIWSETYFLSVFFYKSRTSLKTSAPHTRRPPSTPDPGPGWSTVGTVLRRLDRVDAKHIRSIPSYRERAEHATPRIGPSLPAQSGWSPKILGGRVTDRTPVATSCSAAWRRRISA